MSVGVQFLPVLWVILAVETTALRSGFRTVHDRHNRADRRFVLVATIPLGAVAELTALVALFTDQPVLVAVGAYLLILDLGANLGVAAVGLYGAIT